MKRGDTDKELEEEWKRQLESEGGTGGGNLSNKSEEKKEERKAYFRHMINQANQAAFITEFGVEYNEF